MHGIINSVARGTSGASIRKIKLMTKMKIATKSYQASLRAALAFRAGPAFHVWAQTHGQHDDPCTEVSIAFRGTEKLSDWISNAAILTRHIPDDDYQQLRRNIDAIIKRITKLNCYTKEKDNTGTRPQIVTVGHSLGAGLAKFSALAQRRGPRIAKVFAFDPSPVSGASLVKDVIDRNVKGKRKAKGSKSITYTKSERFLSGCAGRTRSFRHSVRLANRLCGLSGST